MGYKNGDTVTVFDKNGAMQFAVVDTNYRELVKGEIVNRGYIVKLLSSGETLYVNEEEIFKPW